MSRIVKIILYSGLIVCAAIFAYCFSTEYSSVTIDAAGASKSRMMGYAAAFFLALVVVGLLAAYDFSQFVGQKAHEFIFNEDLDGVYDPEYEKAEQVWADGDPLEAIRLMRDYLKKHPAELHVSIRIAEIYERDMQNHLAAALEYEEVLKHKLPAERWGWAAIHLCNLYTKLRQPDKAFSLLRRIETEFGQTAAAAKARERLAQVDPEFEKLLAEEKAEGKTAAAEPARSNLPAGFRPKKS